jgi:ParB family transcriptional regulator, chromosome partitioning protein
VLCELVPAERAVEISLAENSGRQAMHPADEFDAFSALVAQGRSVEDIAERFGVAAVTVRRRLKLAALSPRLLALYREDGIALDQLMALTLTDDHAAQERTWFDARPWQRTAAALRNLLTAGELQATGSALVRFVGLEQFEAAGGVVRRDLFDAEAAGWINDTQLLHQLAADKLQALAAPLQTEGWSWVETPVELDAHTLREFARCSPSLRPATASELQAMDEFNKREAELDALSQAMNEAAEWSALEAERIDLEEQDIAARRAAIVVARQTWTADDKARAGVIVTVGRDGDAEVLRGLLRPAAARQSGAALKRTNADSASHSPSAMALGVTAAGAAPANPPGLSMPLRNRLAAHKTVALQAAMQSNVNASLAVLACTLARQVLVEGRGVDHPVLQLTAKAAGPSLQRAADNLVTSKACQQIDAARGEWLAKLPKSLLDWLPWVAALPQADLLQLLALCTALCMASHTTLYVNVPAEAADPTAAQLEQLVKLNMADWWQPTAAGFLSYLSKAQIVVALKESDPSFAVGAVSALAKGAMVAKAETLLQGKGWLPVPLRLGAS